jgi:hypothetical protein
MDFAFTDEQELIRTEVRNLARKFDWEYWQTKDKTGEYPREFFDEFASAELAWDCDSQGIWWWRHGNYRGMHSAAGDRHIRSRHDGLRAHPFAISHRCPSSNMVLQNKAALPCPSWPVASCAWRSQ